MKKETYRYRIVKEVEGSGRERFFVEYKAWVFWHRWSGLFPCSYETEAEARQKVISHLAFLKANKVISSEIIPPEIVETF